MADPSMCEGCGKGGPTLQCPTCKQLGLPASLFCGQACFRSNWSAHKARHSPEASAVAECSIKTMKDTARAVFKFTGPLRPGLITPKRPVPAAVRRPDYATRLDGTSPSEEAAYKVTKIVRNTHAQLESIRAICRVAREVLDIGIAAAVVGATTDSVDAAVHAACVKRAVYPSTMNYYKFPKSCCTSLNEVVCHGIPDSTVMQDGDILNIDISCFSAEGFHADLNETVFVGRPRSEDDVRLVHTAYEAMMLAIRTAVHVEGLYKHIGDVIDPFVKANGCSAVRTVCGHGLGGLFHCNPNIPHYANNKTPGKMAVGHVFTIEPMVNAGKWQDVTWPDAWTITTLDGLRSAQFEHAIAITGPTSYEILTLPHRRRRRSPPSSSSPAASGATQQDQSAVAAAAGACPEGSDMCGDTPADVDDRPTYQLQLEALGIALPVLSGYPINYHPNHAQRQPIPTSISEIDGADAIDDNPSSTAQA